MNGVHDMGGMDGFGPVIREENEPVFHAEWERRVFALVNGTFRNANINVDELRHAIERIAPALYLASTYYERWLAALETLLIERGVITSAELDARLASAAVADATAADAAHTAAPELAPAAPAIAAAASATVPRARDATASRAEIARRARFALGDRVRARNLNPAGHTRMPRYVRGKTGVVRRDWGAFVFPDTNARHAGTHRQHVYCVEFSARELWGKPAHSRERLYIDLCDEYLELADKKPAAKRPASRRKTAKPKARNVTR